MVRASAGKLVLCTVLMTAILGGNGLAMQNKDEHTKWISSVIQSAATIKPGMTRRQLLRIFEEEGGLSTRTHRQYVYKECPYIKVSVDFAAVGEAEKYGESLDDKIVNVSKPFLEFSIMD